MINSIPLCFLIGDGLQPFVKAGELSLIIILLFTPITGLMTLLGAAIGQIFFKISQVFIGGSLAFAAGAMIYIVNDELIPQ